MRIIPVVAFASLVCLSACIKRPEGVLSDKEMAPVVADLELAEAYMQTQRSGDPGRREALVEYVIGKHGVSRADFDTTMAWYGRNVDVYQRLYKDVDNILARRRRELSGAGDAAVDLDGSDIWSYSRHAMVSDKGASDALVFSIPTAQVDKGERVVWQLRMRSMAEATALLGVEYSNGETSFVNRKVRPSKKFELSLQTDTALKVTRVFGNMHVLVKQDLPVWLDSISLTHLPFDSLEYYNIHGQRLLASPKGR